MSSSIIITLLYFLFKHNYDNFICILANNMFRALFTLRIIIVAFLPLFSTLTSAVRVINLISYVQ